VVHQEIQELVVQAGPSRLSEMVHQEVQEIQELAVSSGSSGANGLNGAGTSGSSGNTGVSGSRVVHQDRRLSSFQRFQVNW
jgi:hypothetical protein